MSFEKTLWIDTEDRKIVAGFQDPSEITNIKFTQGDVVPLRIILLKKNSGNIGTPFSNIELTSETLRAALGRIDEAVTSGTFTLTFDGDTTTALNYNATIAQVQSALDALSSISTAGGVTVSGSDGGPWIVSFDADGARNAITGDLTNIVPVSDLAIFTKTEGDVSTKEVQVLKIKESPIALQESFSLLSAPTIAVTEIIAGAVGINEQQKIKIDQECRGGNFTLSFESKSVTFAYGISAADMQEGLEGLDTIGDGNVEVRKISDQEYDITFIGTEEETDQEMIVADDAGLLGFDGFSADFNLATYNVEELLAQSEENTELFFEIELYLSGQRTTLVRMSATIENDLIDESVAAPPSNGFDWLGELNGKVTGPGTSTDNAIVRFDGTDGDTVQDSGIVIDDSNNITGVGNLTIGGVLSGVTNITLSGTVDGRDVAADGLKLDGIEAGATADQTGAEIKTAYEAESNKELSSIKGAGLIASTTKTISSGSFTQTQIIHALANESAAATDDLDSIVPASGQTELFLTMSDAGQVPTIKHSTGTNTFLLPDDTDIEMKMNSIYHFHHDGTNWKLVGSSASGGSSGGKIAQVVYTEDSTYRSTTTAIPDDDTIPQNTEGGDCNLDTAITPTDSSSKLLIILDVFIGGAGYPGGSVALFKDSDADAIAARQLYANASETVTLIKRVDASSASARTYKARYGMNAGTAYMNGYWGAKFGSSRISSMTIMEILP